MTNCGEVTRRVRFDVCFAETGDVYWVFDGDDEDEALSGARMQVKIRSAKLGVPLSHWEIRRVESVEITTKVELTKDD